MSADQSSDSAARQRQRPHRSEARAATLLAVLFSLLVLGLPLAGTAHAELGSEAPVDDPQYTADTDIVITSTGESQAVQDALPPAGQTWLIDSYPASIPPGYVTDNASFAGIINTTDILGANTAQMYCIDLRTETRVGLGYVNGTWDEGNVPNIGHVNRILNTYYPETELPAGLTNDQKAAAVQTAIWFFTDGYVINPADSLAPAVTAIVNATITAGPLTEPEAPDISITPALAEAPAGGAAGPFTAAAEDAAEITLTAEPGFTVYSDAAGTVPVVNPVASGSQFWVRSDSGGTGPGGVSARAVVTVQTGNVYLYDGATPGTAAAQKLILAATRDLTASADAAVSFYAVGALNVTKAIAGPAAGSQGDVLLSIDCGPGFEFTVTVPAGTTGSVSETFTNIPAGSTCTITEPANGATQSVLVTTALPDPVVIAADTTAAAAVTDNYSFAPGTLRVSKTITGAAAGAQTEVRISVVCTAGGATVLEDTVLIPAGATGSVTTEFPELPAGSDCSVTETANGSTASISATAAGGGRVIIPAGGAVESPLNNAYEYSTITRERFDYGKRELPSTGAATPVDCSPSERC
ncbi:Cys-Gln thioester bond-forming surface protein [Arthrobacter sp. Sa2CUA1]|uniref:Cys-Gln thioester bond-forming surface protein n=1 Tax=Arthrobacter gallicola TaxID=2762225 RepID=A0ABR8UPS4_9MICC|nr:thioester domain-containing protein [Arthrobacter gallicola]MBD7994537.1 Cys-Gln thioester bond-forming surface protein [Arthrobacter gallicola]